MDIKTKGENLLLTHSKLYTKLKEIPSKREIEFLEEFEEDKWFGKPRFKKPKNRWDKDLLKDLRNHLQEIWDFFEKYNYWVDETILPLIDSRTRRISKKSIIFLLENDLWNTDEVYGKYLIEKGQDTTSISYYRFENKYNQFLLKSVNDVKIKEWICRDGIQQIKNHFAYLWFKLETEIQVCIEEVYSKKPKIDLTTNYLKNQLEETISICEIWPEASLLSLGRICEIWLLISLNLKHKSYYEDLIAKAEKAGIINKNQGRLLSKIKRNYNYLKHKTYYQIDKNFIVELVTQFSNMMSVSD